MLRFLNVKLFFVGFFQVFTLFINTAQADKLESDTDPGLLKNQIREAQSNNDELVKSLNKAISLLSQFENSRFTLSNNAPQSLTGEPGVVKQGDSNSSTPANNSSTSIPNEGGQ